MTERGVGRGPRARRGGSRRLWRALVARVDQAFADCERYWHRGRYYVRGDNGTLALVRDPDNHCIELRVTRETDRPLHETPLPRDALEAIRIETEHDVPRALAAVKRITRRRGGRSGGGG